ncbi:uncharacterized protein BHQ10_009695 [Talaromyces amestolkiae]|uniref:BZIP domain-containing protein n=1 Tax=Talaromyces amestolkiae TaxID=1196081 RepID=A0A364LD18_TALAM|nr:uncharacterized protein BHQ10_009695 [Talaromyces amestolkiae]RAO73683.1 hypothetical protein BHQ10_009695 [Talaromyces amestolkiae]
MKSAAQSSSALSLRQMPQQQLLREPEDDWTGVIDQQKRRRLQNRLNQRKYRLKLKVNDGRSSSHNVSEPSSHPSVSEVYPNDTGFVTTFPLTNAAEHEEDDLNCTLAPPGALRFRRDFETAAHQSFLRGFPRIEHLISLRRLNVHRAINDNIRAIGMTPDWLRPDEAISIFNMSSVDHNEDQIPSSLRPTAIQRAVPHHPWLDFFPFPGMRDLMIIAGDRLDEDELCRDLMAFWDTHNTGATLLVWGQPWNPKNWEATEGFVKKWHWLMARSPELLESTNFWRVKRGDRVLKWRLLINSH